MKTVFLGCVISVLLQYSTCYPADDPISNMLSSMSSFANKSESAMESVTTSKNTTQTFSSKTSNILLEAAKKLDITNIKSDEEFLLMLFESVFDIIKDVKSEESLFISDLSTIIPTIIEKCVEQLKAAFFKVFFGNLVPSSFKSFADLPKTAVNASTSAVDVGLKLATALETGKLNAVSQGIDTAEKVVDSIASSVPSNGATDTIKNIVNGSLDTAKGAVDAAKTLETEGSNALSGLLNTFKFEGKLNPVSEGIKTAQKIPDSVPVNASLNSITDEVKNITKPGTSAAEVSSKAATALEKEKLNPASEGIKTVEKIPDSVPVNAPSNGFTDVVKKIIDNSLDEAKGAIDTVKTLKTEGLQAISGILKPFKLGK